MLKLLRSRGRRTAAIWWLVVISSAVVFIFGFSVAPSLIGGGPVAGSAVLGSVNGTPITNGEYQQAIAQSAEVYRQQSGQDATGREISILQEQAWLQLVTERAVQARAKNMGYGASDAEVVYAIRNTPPQWIRQLAVFQTNNQFDLQKYHTALANPNNDWTALEEEVRRILPAQKLEEMVLASARFSEPELRRSYRDRYERAKIQIGLWTVPPTPPDTSNVSEEEIVAYYESHPGEFSGPTQVRAELVSLEKTILPEDREEALARAQAIVEQARSGVDFGQLVADMSGGPLAAQRGDMGNLRASQIPAAARLPIEALGDSGITDPVLEGNNYFIFKAARLPDPGPEPTYHVWQFVVELVPSITAQQQDFDRILELRKAARKSGLGVAAAKMGHATQQSGWFSIDSYEPLLYSVPQGQQSAVMGRVGDVTPAYDVGTGWAILQTIERRPGGLYELDSVRDQVQLAVARKRALEPALAAANRARAAVEAGTPFAEAVGAEGATQTKITELFTRDQPDELLGGSPRAVGLSFALAEEAIGGPLVSPIGVYLIQKLESEGAAEEEYDQIKGQISTHLINTRQQQNFGAWLVWYRSQSEIEDNRGDLLTPR